MAAEQYRAPFVSWDERNDLHAIDGYLMEGQFSHSVHSLLAYNYDRWTGSYAAYLKF